VRKTNAPSSEMTSFPTSSDSEPVVLVEVFFSQIVQGISSEIWYANPTSCTQVFKRTIGSVLNGMKLSKITIFTVRNLEKYQTTQVAASFTNITYSIEMEPSKSGFSDVPSAIQSLTTQIIDGAVNGVFDTYLTYHASTLVVPEMMGVTTISVKVVKEVYPGSETDQQSSPKRPPSITMTAIGIMLFLCLSIAVIVVGYKWSQKFSRGGKAKPSSYTEVSLDGDSMHSSHNPLTSHKVVQNDDDQDVEIELSLRKPNGSAN
jgi:hypothetical protein